MIGPIDIPNELADQVIIPFPEVTGAFLYQDQTPSHKFTTVIASVNDGLCMRLTARDHFDRDLATVVLNAVLHKQSIISVAKPIVIIDGLAVPSYTFDSVAVLSPSCANSYRHTSGILNKRTFAVFPIHRCELSGDEPPDLIELIRHDFLPSLDWTRGPCPKILMAFNNTATGSGSTDTQPRLAQMKDLMCELEALDGAEESWIILENYKHQRCRIEWKGNEYRVERDMRIENYIDRDTVAGLVKAFLSV